MTTMNPSAPLPSSDSVAYAPVEKIVTSMDDMLVDDDKSDQFVPFPPAGAAEVSHETSKDYHEHQKKYEPLLNRSIAGSNPTPHTNPAVFHPRPPRTRHNWASNAWTLTSMFL